MKVRKVSDKEFLDVFNKDPFQYVNTIHSKILPNPTTNIWHVYPPNGISLNNIPIFSSLHSFRIWSYNKERIIAIEEGKLLIPKKEFLQMISSGSKLIWSKTEDGTQIEEPMIFKDLFVEKDESSCRYWVEGKSCYLVLKCLVK